jgi:MoaA/NifB/PqqE/SkfB family radical SAM enzyme
MLDVPVVDIYVTGACNLGCRYCFGELDHKAGMERPVFSQALSLAEHLGAAAVEFCGGEPLLYKDLPWAVDAARQRGFRLILRTNGFYISKQRLFVASNFDSIGISLDGDAKSNDLMRPTKGLTTLSAEEKFQIPLQEIKVLKELNPRARVLLASVATKANVDGLQALAHILIDQNIPLDTWKVYQFVSNNFRALDNIQEFHLNSEQFQQLTNYLAREVKAAFQLVCRKSEQIDGGCLVVNRDGNVLVGSKVLGNVTSQEPESIRAQLSKSGAMIKISENKHTTYRNILQALNSNGVDEFDSSS